MRPWLHIQYQAKAQPPELNQPGERNAAPWLYPWHNPPVFQRKYTRRHAVVLSASGLFAPVLNTSEIIQRQVPWVYPWSEPVRFKRNPRHSTALAASGPFAPTPSLAILPGDAYTTWYMPLSEPRRFKRGLGAHLQQAFTMDARYLRDAALLLQGYNWLSEPKRLKPGLGAQLQRAYFGPDRLLPNPDVTATLNATETNSDIALLAVNVYDSAGSISSGAGARVSITEIPAENDAAASIRES